LEYVNLDMSGSVLDGNQTDNSYAGGGLTTNYGGNVTISDSLVANNTAGAGAGLAIGSSVDAVLTNVTISGNDTSGSAGSGSGAGIYSYAPNGGSIHFINCTITDNTALQGGAFFRNSSSTNSIRLDNTIIAGNSAANRYPDIFCSLDSSYDSSNNLIGDGTNLTGIVNGVNGNQVGTSGTPIDPLLGALADNGGVTWTHDLLPGSPAIDAGDNSLNTADYDGRGTGFDRIVGAAIDIGALEVNQIVVDNLIDEDDGIHTSGDLSLREAIGLANTRPGHDVITFASSPSAQTITLGSQIVISSDVTITGL
ncbi:MAG: hypothetical protein GY835_28235, partial [bacterium]|nr:hypothetical protein [bacterium]